MEVEKRFEHSGQPCWSCQNATGGCPWSDRLEPVPGWDAKPVRRPTGTSHEKRVIMDTYAIKSCPMYLEDEPREMPVKGSAL